MAQERGLGESTIQVTGRIDVRGEQPIVIDRRFAGPQAVVFASSSAAIPLAALLRGSYEGLDISGVTLDITAIDGSRTATVERIALDRTQARAGEVVEATVYERTESGQQVVQKIPVTVPANAPAGQLTLTIGDGNAVQQNTAVTQFTARSAHDLISTYNSLKRTDRLYAVLTRSTSGVVIGSSEMPNLPPSMLATINNDRTAGGTKSSVQTTLFETMLPAGDYIVTGSQSLAIEVLR
jgi:hypothetical protein